MSKTILIADEDARWCKFLKNYLIKHGCEIVGEALNGKDAVEQYKKLHPDLVLLDIDMPEMDGMQALKKIMASDPDARIIVCDSISTEKESILYEAILFGAKDFFTKPERPDGVLTLIDNVLSKQSQRASRFAKYFKLAYPEKARLIEKETTLEANPDVEKSTGKRILVTDDSAFMRMTISNILKNDGYEIVGEAGNGKVAVELYKKLKPDLVIMDITMPEMDGMEALKEIRALDPNAVVVMCSAMGQKKMVEKSMQSGAKDFIIKPFQAERVLEVIKKVLG